MGVEFEWDSKKAKSNKAAHRVDFQEALTVFADPLARIFEDEQHSEKEPARNHHRTLSKTKIDFGVLHGPR